MDAVFGAGAGALIALAEGGGALPQGAAGGLGRDAEGEAIGIVGEAARAGITGSALRALDLVKHPPERAIVAGPVGLGGGAPAQQAQPAADDVLALVEEAPDLPLAGFGQAQGQPDPFATVLSLFVGIPERLLADAAQIHGDAGAGGGEDAFLGVALAGVVDIHGGVDEGDGDRGVEGVRAGGVQVQDLQGGGEDEGEGVGRLFGVRPVEGVDGEGEGLAREGVAFKKEAEGGRREVVTAGAEGVGVRGVEETPGGGTGGAGEEQAQQEEGQSAAGRRRAGEPDGHRGNHGSLLKVVLFLFL